MLKIRFWLQNLRKSQMIPWILIIFIYLEFEGESQAWLSTMEKIVESEREDIDRGRRVEGLLSAVADSEEYIIDCKRAPFSLDRAPIVEERTSRTDCYDWSRQQPMRFEHNTPPYELLLFLNMNNGIFCKYFYIYV